jgi:hypothetical protein
MSGQVQIIVEHARRAFVPGRARGRDAAELVAALDATRAEHFDLAARMRAIGRAQGWHSVPVHEEEAVHIGLFLLPRGHGIPLHGHPGMTVLMRVLWGHLRIRAYDWAAEHPFSGLARPAYDRVLHGGHGTLPILPEHGNLHSVDALDDCAFLDVISPPYDHERPCHYYDAQPVEAGGERLLRLVRQG